MFDPVWELQYISGKTSWGLFYNFVRPSRFEINVLSADGDRYPNRPLPPAGDHNFIII